MSASSRARWAAARSSRLTLCNAPRDQGYPDKVNYELVQQDGEALLLSGSASLARQINEHDIGKFVKCEFTGWGKSANGKFKMIDVNVWEGEPSDVMKEWPRFAEFHSKGKAPAKAVATAPTGDDDFPGALADEDDDLPF
jgi:hypothetical protein